MIDCDEALDRALAEVVRIDPHLDRLMAIGGRPPLRKRDPGFEGLAAIVVAQQLSTASASAIWRRVKLRFDTVTAAAILDATDDDLRACGLSSPKVRTLRACAEAVACGAVPLDQLHAMEAGEAHGHLVTVRGIGPWTADIYLLFCLGHPDAFPAGDLALQEAVRMGYDLPSRPTAKDLDEWSQRWRPWRGAAAKLLWAYYGACKKGAGLPIVPGPEGEGRGAA
ncbi:DNA-3-methyladenine glycosylase family protein [Alsobacter sp. R-9]